jgi:CubicO group peptidase (beta-lactamase class C family)
MISRRGFVLTGLYAAAATLRARQGDRFRDLELLIRELMTQAVVPGVAIAFIKDAAVVWHREFGVRDAESKAPVDERTLFEMASVSKTVFAYAVMQLVDRGTITLDAPLVRYTPDRILKGDPRLDAITARHVLSHTGGLPNFGEPLAIHFTPGEKWEYSGEGYWYLQSVLTRLVGKVDTRTCRTYENDLEVCATDIDDYLRANVLMPLGMRSSAYVWNDTIAQHKARPHDASGKPVPIYKATATDAARYAAAGGLHSTALEYANFLIEVMSPRAPAGFRLSDASRREMMRRQIKVDEKAWWGLGWQIPNVARGIRIQHQGGQSGVQTFAAAQVDRRSGYVILTNSDNGWKVFYNERFTALVDRLLTD